MVNRDSIGVNRGQARVIRNPLDLTNTPPPLASSSSDVSPSLSNMSFYSVNQSPSMSLSEKLKSPANLTICSLALILVAGLWIAAGYLVQALSPLYDNSSLIAYFSVISLQIYFFFIPKRPLFPNRGADGTITVDEADLGLDTYTNREAFKIAGYLFILFSVSIGLLIKGLAVFSQSSYCGVVGLLSVLSLIFLFCGMKTESITRYKVASIILMVIASAITIFEPSLRSEIELSSLWNYGLWMSFAGILLLALFFTVLEHQLEHTHIHKPMLFGFMGLLSMLVMWVVFIPFHIYGIETLAFPPPREDVYWEILGIVTLGTVVPFYIIQWALSRTSVLFVTVLLGSIIPLHGIVESVYFLEWNWVNFVASIIGIISIIIIQYRYK